MVKEGGYKIEDIYLGGYSSLDPNYGNLFTGYRADVGKLGVSTDPRTANILKEISDKIAPGQKGIELSLISPEIVEVIPKQHLKEVNRLAKLTGVDVTVHGPLVDASGISRNGFNESQREIAERKIIQTIERSHEINPDGNIPVTFHTANELPGAKWKKLSEEEARKQGINEKDREFIDFLPVVDQETGQINVVKHETKFRPYYEKIIDGKVEFVNEVREETWDVGKQIKNINHTNWDKSMQEMIVPKEHADRILRETAPLAREIINEMNQGKLTREDLKKFPTKNEIMSRFENAHEQLKDIHSHLSTLFGKAYEYGSDMEKDKLRKAASEFGENLKNGTDIFSQSNAIQSFMEELREVEPQVFKSAEKYALDKSKITFGNAAWNSYKKFKDKAPIISIENPPAGFGLSRAKDVKEMVEGAREMFVKNAVEEGMGEDAAKRQAEKLIGATWDVGHINQLRQFGFSGKDIIKEAEKIAPYVKHVHLSDNFGMENTELPMGMGNVDLKEVMEKLGKQGKDARKIIEAAHWWQHHQSSPVGVSMEALGSPVYGMHMGPYWNQSPGFSQGYFGGYGGMLPSINYETFGAGFSNLPSDLGGQRPGAGGSRMSGRPME